MLVGDQSRSLDPMTSLRYDITTLINHINTRYLNLSIIHIQAFKGYTGKVASASGKIGIG